MVVTEQEEKEFLTVLKDVVSGGLHLPALIEELETGIVHKEDNTYTYDDRWDFEYHANSDVILASEEFMRVVTAATYAVGEEWGGLIFGRVIHFKNNCNVFVCEKVAIMAQVRGSADFEIKDEHYQDWARTPEFIEFLGADFARIGWVHSHVNMGCFWSGTDIATVKQLIEEETNDHIISLVVSKRSDTSLDVKWLTSNRNVHNGVQYRVPEATSKELPSWKIHYEVGGLPCWNAWDEDFQAHWKTRMAELTVIRSAVTTYQKDTYSGSAVGSWSDARAQAFGKKVQLDIPAFILLISDHDAVIRTLLESSKKWKMKKIVPAIAETELIKIMDFFLKTSNRVQQYLIAYTNFEELAKSFVNNLTNRINREPAIKEVITGRYGVAWTQLYKNALVAKTYTVASGGTTTTTYQRPPKAPDWDELFFGIESQHQKGIINALLKVEGVIFKEVVKKLVDSLEWRVKNEEDKWVDAFVTIWIAMNEYRAKYKRESTVKEITTGIEAVLDGAFKTYRGKGDKAKNGLQTVVNCLPDELVFAFMQDFVADVSTQEELDHLYEQGKVSVRSKMYACEVCKNWCPTLKDAEACKENCKKIELKKSKGLGTAIVIKNPSEVDKSPKEEAATTQQTTLTQGTTTGQTGTQTTGSSGMDNNPLLYGGVHICGITPNYWKAETVCNQCGMEYTSAEQALVCEETCKKKLSDNVEDIISLAGYAICSDCGTYFTDMVEFASHMASTECEMIGMTLHTTLRLYCIQTDTVYDARSVADFSLNFEEFSELVLKPMNDITNDEVPALYPALLKWLANILAEQKSLWYCGKCGTTFKDFADPLDALYKRFYHEGVCQGRGVVQPTEFVEGTIPIRYQLLSYFCGMCNYRKGFFHEEDLMKHLHEEHSVDLQSAILNVTIVSEDEIKDQYPEWLSKKYEIDCALNECQYCKIPFVHHLKMEDNVRDCFEHEFKCGKRFPRNISLVKTDDTVVDVVKNVDITKPDIIIISTPDGDPDEGCVKEENFECTCPTCLENDEIEKELDEIDAKIKAEIDTAMDALRDSVEDLGELTEEKKDES